jgi:hypothetical protein
MEQFWQWMVERLRGSTKTVAGKAIHAFSPIHSLRHSAQGLSAGRNRGLQNCGKGMGIYFDENRVNFPELKSHGGGNAGRACRWM